MKFRKVRQVYNGIDLISNADFLLRGKRLAILTNASGVNRYGVPSSQIVSEKYGLDVIFAPEHGVSSNLQDGFGVKSQKDKDTDADIINVYHPDENEINEAFDKIDAVVYDIQDVGARYYTYLYNLAYLMRKCKEFNKEMIVLDRVNVIGGVGIEGCLLDVSRFTSGIGEFAIPIRYGLTVGEFANFINKEYDINCNMNVVACQGWQRNMYGDQTGLLWVNPSPNMPSVNTAINYIATCVFEATNISEGRGTTRPFDMIGAPYVDSKRLCERMTSQKLPGVVFRKADFIPKFSKYSGEVCHGVELHITDRREYNPFETMLYLYREFSYYREFEASYDGVCKRIGNDCLFDEFIDPDKIISNVSSELSKYKKKAARYLMY